MRKGVKTQVCIEDQVDFARSWREAREKLTREVSHVLST